MHQTTTNPVDLATTLSILFGLAIPFVTELVTKQVASETLRKWINSALALVGSVIPTVVFDPKTGWHGYVLNIGLALVSSFTAHHSGAPAATARKVAPHVGLGGQRPNRAHRRTATKRKSTARRRTNNNQDN